MSEQDVFNATVTSRADLNEILTVVRVRPDDGEVPKFLPGQYITLGLPRDPKSNPEVTKARSGRARVLRRPYSIASGPEEPEIELFVVKVDQGRLTEKLWTVEEGGRVWLDKRIYGDFTLDSVPPGKDIICLSTGTGLAPFISMLRHFRGKNRWRKYVVLNGVRQVRDLGYYDELMQAQTEDPSVFYVPLVSRAEPHEWDGIHGRVQAALDPEILAARSGCALDPETTHVFLCGNPQMIVDCEALLLERGFTLHTRKQPGNLHYERYW